MRVFVSAGEPSGETYAADLVRALRERFPHAVVDALGGALLAAAGATLVERNQGMARMGFVEGLAAAGHHAVILRRLARRFAATPYDVAVLVDYPGFHLRVARAARRRGIPVLQYVAPQVWAWGAWRLRAWRTVSHLAVVLPFEEGFFRREGIGAAFVGHPLVRAEPLPSADRARHLLGLAAARPTVALLPGSRPADVRRHWPAFRDAAKRLGREIRDLQVIVAGVRHASYPGCEQATIALDRPTEVLRAADAALCKSGSTTLHAAITGTPHVVAYRAHPVSFAIGQRLVRVPWIGLPSLIAGRALAPELLQGAATADRLADAVRPLLDRAGRPARSQREAFELVTRRLGPPGASHRTADLVAFLAA